MEARFSKEGLEEYFRDLQALFEKRYRMLIYKLEIEEKDERRMIELVKELFYVKRLIEQHDFG